MSASVISSGPVSIRVKENKFPQIAANLSGHLDRFIRKAAFDIEAHAKTAAPYRTGFLSSSITAYKVQEAWWRVSVGAEYGAHVEFGTRFMAAQPYLLPAFERVVPSLMRALGGLSKGLVG